MSLLALALGLATGGEPFAVTWDAPADCGSADAVSARAVEVLDDALANGERFERVVAHGRVEPAEDSWRVELRYRVAGVDDVRTFEAPDCDGLVEGAALVLALAATPMPTPEPTIVREAPTVATPRPTAAPERPRPGFAIRGDAGVVAGVLGPVWPVVGGSVALRYRALRVELGGMHAFARRYVLHDTGFAAGAAISLSAVTLRGCGVPTAAQGRVEFPICAGAILGGATARGFGDLDGARTRRQAWIALLAGPGLTVPLGQRFAIALSIDAVVALVRPAFRVDTLSPELYRVPLVGARAGLGFEVRLP